MAAAFGRGLPYGACVAMEPIAFSLAGASAQAGDLPADSSGEASYSLEHLTEVRVEGSVFTGKAVYPMDGPADAGSLAELEASFDGEVLELAITPAVDFTVRRSSVTLRHAFASDEHVLLNGYQSWTDTAERSPWARMRGLAGVPMQAVGRYTLDGGGDYAFAGYSGARGVQHGFTYATFRRGEGMVLVGSLDDTRGFTMIRTDAGAGTVVLETEPPELPLDAGERVVLGRYAVVRGDSDACYNRYFELAGIKARPVSPLVGYTSWYRHYGDIDEGKLLADLKGMGPAPVAHADVAAPAPHAGKHVAAAGPKARHAAESLEGEGGGRACEPYVRLFQVDDGYCKVGDWTQVDKRKFPRGLKAVADAIRDAGFLPGLWVAPFVCEKDSRLFVERGEWLLRDDEGNPVPTGCQWSGGFALDTRNTEVRTYVLDALRTMTREWGFGLLKVDFLYAACMAPHDGLNRGQLMADAMRLLRMGAGEDTLLLGCGVPLASAFGVVDYCRIGCDVGLDWDDKPHMRLLHRERVSTKNSLGNTYGRSPLDGRAFGNDPDVFFLREDVKLTQAQRDELLFADAELGSVFLTSDDQASWTEPMRERYDEALRLFLERGRALGWRGRS